MKLIRLVFLTLLSGFSLYSYALAIPVEWTLQNVSFEDGGMATGSFVFDKDLDKIAALHHGFSHIDITTTDDVGNAVATYRHVVPIFNDGPFILMPNSEVALFVQNGTHLDQTGENALLLAFGFGLTNRATFNDIFSLSVEGFCGTENCDTFIPQRDVVVGSIVGVPVPEPPLVSPDFPLQEATVPEPSSMILLSSGLIGLIAWRWNKSRE